MTVPTPSRGSARCTALDDEFGRCHLRADHDPWYWHAGEVDGEGWEDPAHARAEAERLRRD